MDPRKLIIKLRNITYYMSQRHRHLLIYHEEESPKNQDNQNPHDQAGLIPVIQTLWEAKVGRSLEVGSSRPAWATWQKPVSTKNTKISQAWWCSPVIPATREAETGELLEPGRQRLQ